MDAEQLPGRVFLKVGRDKPARGGNPWIFSQAIERLEPSTLEPGSPVEIFDSSGSRLAFGYYNPSTTIAVRILDWGHGPTSLPELLALRLERAHRLRLELVGKDTDCFRLINGDGDGLSGLVVDRYGEVLVVQILTAGMERLRSEVVAWLQAAFAPRAIIERSLGAVRREEGLEDRTTLLAGVPTTQVQVVESGLCLEVAVATGQKTGHFLDQRENRARFGKLARKAAVLDAYCYTGGFALAALAGGAASVVAIDTSARALHSARHNRELNSFGDRSAEFLQEDVRRFLAATDRRFDLIVLDPPPLARSRADVSKAQHLYVELNSLALRALAPGGRLMTFSCSVHFRGEDFVHAVRIAQLKAGRNLRTLAHLGAGPDHPVLLGHVEGEYLTGLLLEDL